MLQVQRQMAQSKGLVGYTMDADLPRLWFWTLSVWEDRRSLTDFVHAIPHQEIMRKIAPLMKQPKFVYWKIEGREIPLRWDDAKARLSSAQSH
jgi:Domain of unknown function (DUF3291)